MSNLSALNASNNLRSTNLNRSKTMEKLSSGLRINRAADDAAGLAISEKMRGQIRGLEQASRNIQDGISLIQTAEGAMQEIHAMLQRMNELAVQSANGTYNDGDRANLDLEFQELKREINGIAKNTSFNGIKLLNGGSLSSNNTISYLGENFSSFNFSTLVGNSNNIHNAIGVTIIEDVNDELTVKFNGTEYSIKIATGHYFGSTTALYNDINNKLEAIGAPVALFDAYSHWDTTHMRTQLISKIAGNHTIEVEGTAFNEIFAQESNFSGTHQVWGREADFSIGYTVQAGVNDTLNFIDEGVHKTIVLRAGSYSRDELIIEMNDQLSIVGANITASMSAKIGVNESDGPGNSHYILQLKHNFSTSQNAIQLVSGNALNPLFMRSAFPGDVWNPMTTSYLKTSIDLSTGITVEVGSTEWEFIVDEDNLKTITLEPGSYTSTEIINILNAEFERISAGIVAVEEDGLLKFEREMNGSSYSITEFNIKGSNGTELNLQVGANAGDIFTIELADLRLNKLNIMNTSLFSQQAARSTISSVKDAVEFVSAERARFGAYQNRLEYTQNNVLNYAENLTTTESKIRDADMAKEMLQLTKNQLLLDAGHAILAQANTMPQGVLRLLS